MIPLRNQGFTDDFAFAQSVRNFLNTGSLKISEWSAPSLVFHVYWGYLFTSVLGFSFTSLQLSVISLLPLLIIFIYFTLINNKIEITQSLMFAVFFLSIPWIIQFSFTFMTDIPFLTLEVVGIYYYIQGFKPNKNINLLFGSTAASLAFLIRQTGVILPIAALIAIIVKGGQTNKDKLHEIILCIIFPILTLTAYYFWVRGSNETIAQIFYKNQTVEIIRQLNPLAGNSANIASNEALFLFHKSLNYISQLIGLFAPIVFLILISNLKKLPLFCKKHFLIISLSTAVFLFIYALDIVLYKQGFTVGYPAESLLEYDYFLPFSMEKLWTLIVLFSIPFWSTYFSISLLHLNLKKVNVENLFLVLSFLGIFTMTILAFYSWGEYVIPFLPFVLYWLSKLVKKFPINPKIATAVIFLLLLNSVQMAKIRYDENGIAWEESVNLLKSGIAYSAVNPNYNMAWIPWFSFEDNVASKLKQTNGDKNKVEFPINLPKVQEPLYIVASERNIKRERAENNKASIKLEIKSLFVKWNLVKTTNLQ